MPPTDEFSGNAAELAAHAIERGRAYGLPVDPDRTNERLVRYYVSEGVIDRPDRVGRDAAYGQRHLLQLLTARRMAQAGMSLAVIAEHNRNALTRTLAEGLDKPLPTQAELLVGRFMQDKTSPRRAGVQAAAAPAPAAAVSHRPSMALPDVLDEVRRFRDEMLMSMDANLQKASMSSDAARHALADQVMEVVQQMRDLQSDQMKRMEASHMRVYDGFCQTTDQLTETMRRLEVIVRQQLLEIEARQAQDTRQILHAIGQLNDRLDRLDRLDARPPPEPDPQT